MKTIVSLSKCMEYKEDLLRRVLEETLSPFSSVLDSMKSGQKVLLKPNLLVGKSPEAAVTTHPLLVKVVAQFFLEKGLEILIGDSPALGSGKKAAKKAGLIDALKDLPLSFIEFSANVPVESDKTKTFRHFEVAPELKEVDYIINLPKVKTHGLMVLTMAVKNLFGCIAGSRKQQWHLQAGTNPEFFASMLVELSSIIKPTLTIVDGIVGMEGNGPHGGTPRKLGFLTAGTDPVAIDRVLLEILSIAPSRVYTQQAAEELNIGQWDFREIVIVGDSIESFKVKNFQLPHGKGLSQYLPSFVTKYLKEFFTEKPLINRNTCTRCLTCIAICPPQVMSLQMNGVDEYIAIDQKKCIQCFCCQETCPEGAITIKKGLGKVLSGF